MIESTVFSRQADLLRWAVRERWHLLRLSLEDRKAGFSLLLVHLGTALVPAASALSTGWLVTEMTNALSGHRPVSATVLPLVVMSALLVTDEVLKVVSSAVDQYTAGRLDAQVRRRVRSLALSPQEMTHLEDPCFANDAARASQGDDGAGARSPGVAAVGQLRLAFRMVAAFGAAAVVAVKFSFPLALILVVTSLTMRALLRRWWMKLAQVGDERIGLMRRAVYWTDIASRGPAAKEVRLFGLHDWVVQRRTREVVGWAEGIWSAHRDVLRKQYWIAILAAIAAGSALLFPALATVHGILPIADLMTVLVAAWAVFAISVLGQEAYDIEFGLSAVRALDRLTGAHASNEIPAVAAEVRPGIGPPRVRAEGLVFRYPGTDDVVVDGLDLLVRPGEVLAVVGHNGAGKTTLIKLIAGLYLPTTGRLSIDGHTLDGRSLAAWRHRVAAVFQNFNQYPLSAADNIALAAPEHAHDLDAIRAAARRAGADIFIDQLPDGYSTLLTPHQSGGTDLSGGQWQRIAIARAIFAVEHGRDLLILDEPTAHLDVEAEAAFYRRVVSEVTETTVILISHRLSTVRNADRIVLLNAGRIVEQGSHDELMAENGGYARLFRLQAARFTGTTQ